MTTLDILIAIPAIPVVPILATWWLPWERWIPDAKLPKIPLGAYLLYLCFAAWHFDFKWWMVMLIFTGGGVLLLMGLEEKYRK